MITVRIIFKYNKYLKNLIFKKFKIYKMMLMIDYDIEANYEAIKIFLNIINIMKKYIFYLFVILFFLILNIIINFFITL